MIRFTGLFSVSLLAVLLPACASQGGTYRQAAPFDGRGQYVRPEYLAAAPTLRLPPVDACRSQLYQGLVGRHEGAIYIAGLPGRKRILKPATDEGFNYQSDDSFFRPPDLIEVREYIPDQSLYAPSITTVTNRLQLGPEQGDRLTLELDARGYVQEIRCE